MIRALIVGLILVSFASVSHAGRWNLNPTDEGTAWESDGELYGVGSSLLTVRITSLANAATFFHLVPVDMTIDRMAIVLDGTITATPTFTFLTASAATLNRTGNLETGDVTRNFFPLSQTLLVDPTHSHIQPVAVVDVTARNTTGVNQPSYVEQFGIIAVNNDGGATLPAGQPNSATIYIYVRPR